ncbi:D-glycero-beta-D-manno-heptose-7-phosphate kinase [Sphingobium sp. DC-2]|uniref:D-glycero-beta-D-manno-heptose-7-phosphate kinase n=1 Tax=Sphingobium sp. DC-2 TaxID=1303256 RepID=UPI0004C3E712|nr:D-glycero-beta-D-manno-heptose-7-phosphate kinase [Sphingobium sp. DC-2]
MIRPKDFSFVRTICVGDLMLDRFIYGAVTRISPESPVPVIAIERTESVPGGAANVTRNIAAMNGECSLIGVIGNDKVGSDLIGSLSEFDHVHFVPINDDARPTIEKTRYVAQGQQLLRADHESVHSVSKSAEDRIYACAVEMLQSRDVLVISDYAKGVVTDGLLRRLIPAARLSGVPVIIDPKSSDLTRYAGATVLTPNINEARAATGMMITNDAEAEAAGLKMLAMAQCDAILLTRSEQGMSLFRRDQAPLHISASAREVFDVSGAGDTVVATLAIALGGGMTMDDAARMANAAAGLVVGKRGTATVSISEVQEELNRLAEQHLQIPSGKVRTLRSARVQREDWAARGLTVGFTNGCFDILHLGHVKLLEFARSQCDRLVVGLNSDASVKRLKGSARPLNMEMDRAQILAALAFVDQVLIFEEDTPLEAIKALQPDLLIKGADYKLEDIVGADIVHARGGRVVTFDLLPDRSTSRTIVQAALRNGDAGLTGAAIS